MEGRLKKSVYSLLIKLTDPLVILLLIRMKKGKKKLEHNFISSYRKLAGTLNFADLTC